MSLILLVFFILLLVLLSAFFSASETALLSINRAKLQRMANGSGTEQLIYATLQRPKRLLGGILLGNMFVNVLMAGLFATLLERICHGISTWQRSLLNVAIVTPLLILLGEQTPKVLAYSYGIPLARFAIRPLEILCILLAPINYLLNLASTLLLKIFGLHTVSQTELTDDELKATLTASQKSGATTRREHQILQRIAALGEIDAKEIMTPRVDIQAIPDTLTLRDALQRAFRMGHSVYPIYHGSPEQIWAILNLKDFQKWRNTPFLKYPLTKFRRNLRNSPLRLPRFTPEMVKIDKLFHNMRRYRQDFLIVVDEFGETEGIVTMKDIQEEILGHFRAGGMPDDEAVRPQTDGTILVSGRIRLRALQRQFGNAFENTEGEADTISGFLMEQMGRLPQRGDSLTLKDGTELQVREMAGHRVRTVAILQPVIQETVILSEENEETTAADSREDGR